MCQLCHLGQRRLLHFLRARNLPYSIEDVKAVISSCPACTQLKPRFFRPPSEARLIKATQPFKRLSIDFKGPIPSATKNRYLLTMVDKYSRFPFAFPCPDMATATVVRCLTSVFAIFGMPAFIHSDRGAQFMSSELRAFLTSKGVAMSRTSPYRPEANGQCERYNRTIWKAVQLGLQSRKLDVTQWEVVLPDALHSIWSLLSVATNCTPHERIFAFNCHTSNRFALPSWLMEPGPVLLRRQIWTKTDPLVDEVELLEANPRYAHIRFPNGREDTVSLRDLAPVAAFPAATPSLDMNSGPVDQRQQLEDRGEPVDQDTGMLTEESAEDWEIPRWSGWERREPDCYTP